MIINSPDLTPEDAVFLSVLPILYGPNTAAKYWPKKPADETEWLSAYSEAFRDTVRIYRTQIADLGIVPTDIHFLATLDLLWPRFVAWHHDILGAALRTEDLDSPRLEAIRSVVQELQRQGHVLHLETAGLARQLLAAARRRPAIRGIKPGSLDDADVLATLVIQDSAKAVFLGADGVWRLNLSKVLDALRCSQVSQHETLKPSFDLAEATSLLADDAAVGLQAAELARFMRDLRDQHPSRAAAVTRRFSGRSRRDVAEEFRVTQDAVRHAEGSISQDLGQIDRILGVA